MQNFLKQLFQTTPGQFTIQPTMLVIMDGWGIAPPSRGNVIDQAKIPNLQQLMARFPNTELIASGESVGLPANEVGNTEVGHLTLGAGRVIFQGLKRINVAVEDGTFLRNKGLISAMNYVREHNSRLHIMGLLSTGNVHASLPHFNALLELCKREGMSNVAVHAFTDGRDAPPKEAIEMLNKINAQLTTMKIGEITSVSGRYFAMDRDRRWDRIQKTYEMLTEGKGLTAESVEAAVRQAYDKGKTDELVEPTVIVRNGAPLATINDNDAVIFINFRIDRPKQLTMAFTLPDFERFNAANFGYSDENGREVSAPAVIEKTFQRTKVPKNLYFVTMMNYHKNIPVSTIAFNSDVVEQPMTQIISENNLRQLHMAESEKERFVTYYFDGYREDVFPGEETHIVPSPKVPTYDKKPEMSVELQVRDFKRNLGRDQFHFLVMNIANPDMVAHTGNIAATIKAVEATDRAIGEIAHEILERNGTLCITADHGNAEELITYPSSSFFFTTSKGTMNTDHSNNPVPFIIANKKFENAGIHLPKGKLSDVAPTVLHLMNLPIPKLMTGQNLLP